MNHRKEKLIGQGLCILLCIGLWSCKNEKSWFYKQWHNTLAHYNTFFNAEQKWLETVETTREAYKDDFRKPIELFNYGSLASLQANQSAMDDVVKRTSTMIDRHPKSKWVDDAYHLMGKAYLLKGDANAALDLFDYVSSQYKDPHMQFLNKLWTIRALLLKDKIIEAEAAAQAILTNKELPEKLLPMANFTLGAIYHKQKKYKQSAELLEKALPHLRDRMDKYRTFFALGQAYQATEEFDKAEQNFAKIPRFNPPYEIAFNAQISRVEILSVRQKNYAKANSILMGMLKDDKNIEYKGQIYFRIAKNELNAGKTQQAIDKFKTSIYYSKSDLAQKTTSYLSIGDIYYNQKQYEMAGTYYDSANQSIDEKHPDFDAILAKNEIFGDLLKNLIRIKTNDSLIRMANDKDWRKTKIKEAIQREKLAEQQSKLPQPKAPTTISMPGNPDAGGLSGMNTNSSFPFYNMMSRNKGEQDFIKIWGKRENKDYWRISSRKQNTIISNNSDTNTKIKENKIDTTLLVNVPQEEKRFYSQLPLTQKAQEEKMKETESSLFTTAEIYQNRLKENQQAIYYYKQLLDRFPSSDYTAQTYYELIKLSRLIFNEADAEMYQGLLRQKFPTSIYVKLLDNPNLGKTENTDRLKGSKEIVQLYDSMIVAFNGGKYEAAKKIKLGTDKLYAGNSMQPRFDFVFALCCAKLNDPKAMSYFEQITQDYPNTDISERSHSILNIEKKKTAEKNRPKDSLSKTDANSYEIHNGKSPLSCILVVPKGSNMNMVKANVSDLNKKEFALESIEVGTSITIGSKYVLNIQNFSSPEKAKFYQQFLSKQTDFFAAKGVFEFEVVWITEKNLKLLLSNLSLPEYLKLFKEGKI